MVEAGWILVLTKNLVLVLFKTLLSGQTVLLVVKNYTGCLAHVHERDMECEYLLSRA